MKVDDSAVVDWSAKNRLITGGRSVAAKAICEYTGLANPIMAIRKLSGDLVIESGQTQPPYGYEAYAREMKADIALEDYNIGCDGRVFPFGGGYLIELYSKQSRPRLRFCCCHEIGHIFFMSIIGSRLCKVPPRVDYRIDLLTEVSEEERLCNIAASELLMPFRIFKEESSSRDPGIKSIKELADTFGVSFLASAIRILETGVWKCIAIVWLLKDREWPWYGFRVYWAATSRKWKFVITPEKIRKIEETQNNAIESKILDSYLTGKNNIEDMENGYIIESTRMSLDGNNTCVFSLIYKPQWSL